MQKVLELALEKYNTDMELLKYKHQDEVKRIEEMYELKIESLNRKIKSTGRIRWDKSNKYFSLGDFCRNTRDILFIKESEIKQYYMEEGVLRKENDKYIPNSNMVILVDGELYMEYSLLRRMMALRSILFFGDADDLQSILEPFAPDGKDLMTKRLGNTVYVECKQRSEEFRNHRENIHNISNKTNESIGG